MTLEDQLKRNADKLDIVQRNRLRAWQAGNTERTDALTERIDALLDERLELRAMREPQAA